MNRNFRKMNKDERGITGLETAIILIAFVVVAAVFSFAVLSAGTFATDKSKDAIYSGISQVQSTMEMKGSVIGKSTSNNSAVEEIVFMVANVAGGEAIDMTAPTIATGVIASSSAHKVVISYLDSGQHVNDMPWSKTWIGTNDGDDLLEPGEMAEITIVLTATGVYSNPLTTGLGINTKFRLEVKPGMGATLLLERTTPAYLDSVFSLF